MENVEPIHRVRDEKARDLAALIIETARAPLLMLHSEFVRRLVQRTSVELVKSVRVVRKVPGHPIENDAESRPVKLVHEIGKSGWRAVAACRRIVRRHLISPTCVERIFGYTHKLEMCITHVFKIRHYFVCEFAIRKCIAVLIATPRSHMTFVYIDGFGIRRCPRAHILAVSKFVIIEGIDLACRSLVRFGMESVRIGFVQAAFYGVEIILVIIIPLYSFDLSFPYTRSVFKTSKRTGFRIPIVKVAHHAHALCCGRPHAKDGARALLVKLTSHEAVGIAAHSAVELRLRGYIEFHCFLQE